MNRVAIQWRPNLHAYLADCACGLAEPHLRLSEAEAWALGHECRPRPVDELLAEWRHHGGWMHVKPVDMQLVVDEVERLRR